MEIVLVIALGLVLSVIGLGLAVSHRKVNGKNARRLLGMNVMSLFGMVAVATIVLVAGGIDAFAALPEMPPYRTCSSSRIIAAMHEHRFASQMKRTACGVFMPWPFSR